MAKKVKINKEEKVTSPDVLNHIKALFEQYPHINTIWVNGNEWYFFDKPGFVPIERDFGKNTIEETDSDEVSVD